MATTIGPPHRVSNSEAGLAAATGTVTYNGTTMGGGKTCTQIVIGVVGDIAVGGTPRSHVVGTIPMPNGIRIRLERVRV